MAEFDCFARSEVNVRKCPPALILVGYLSDDIVRVRPPLIVE